MSFTDAFFKANLFANVRKAALDLPENEFSELISHNNLLKEIYSNEQICTLSFMDGHIAMIRFSNCFVLPIYGYFCERDDNDFKKTLADQEEFDNAISYSQYVIGTPTGEVKRNIVWQRFQFFL